MADKSEIVDEWYLVEDEPDLLLFQYAKPLSKTINYYQAYSVMISLFNELGFSCKNVEIVLARRHNDLCGICRTFILNKPFSFKYKIVLYKGSYTVGVLLHELAHVLVNEFYSKLKLRGPYKMHGIKFKGWLITIVRIFDNLSKTDPFLIDLWD